MLLGTGFEVDAQTSFGRAETVATSFRLEHTKAVLDCIVRRKIFCRGRVDEMGGSFSNPKREAAVEVSRAIGIECDCSVLGLILLVWMGVIQTHVMAVP